MRTYGGGGMHGNRKGACQLSGRFSYGDLVFAVLYIPSGNFRIIESEGAFIQGKTYFFAFARLKFYLFKALELPNRPDCSFFRAGKAAHIELDNFLAVFFTVTET